MIHVVVPGGIPAAIDKALASVDESAGAARARYITVSPGQAETYQAKYEDALAYQVDPTVEHPWVTADAAAFDLTEAAAAQAIIDQRNAWVVLGTQIERVRLQRKAEIKQAATAREALDIAAAAKTELEAV